MPLIVVPFHDPRWLESALANVRRQLLRLPALMVLNGEARGLSVPGGLPTVASAEDSHAGAVNVGVAWARRQGFTHVILLDSDDYYGPGYAEKVVAALRGCDYCGQRELFTRLQDGSVHLLRRPGRCFVFGTVGFVVEKFLPVTNELDNCRSWTLRMDAEGCTSSDTGPAQYCYIRHGANAHWDGRIADVGVRAAWGPSLNYGRVSPAMCAAYDELPFEECPVPSADEIFDGMDVAVKVRSPGCY